MDIWQCNAHGVYSDISSESTLGQTYLRGVQFTDKHGQVTFKTLFPGHYSGRTTHIHARIHISSADSSGKLTAGHIAHTGQIFPPDAVNAEVYKLAPYDTETVAVVTHSEDHVWTQQHGSEGLLSITKLRHRLSKGLAAGVTMAVNPNATPALIGATADRRDEWQRHGRAARGAIGPTAALRGVSGQSAGERRIRGLPRRVRITSSPAAIRSIQ